MALEQRLDQNIEAEQAELKAVLESKLFARAPSMAQFLAYICSKHFEGQAHEIKEYTVAVEAFGRPADFQQKEDPIVRVEANRLRKRLRQYYESEGRDHALRITVPPGQYAPRFERAQDGLQLIAGEFDPEESTSVGDGQALGAGSHLPQPPIGTALQLEKVNRQVATILGVQVSPAFRRQSLRYALPLAMVIGLMSASSWWLSQERRGASDPVQTPVPPRPPLAAAVELAGSVDDGREVRILAGSTASKYVDRLGRVWSGDQFFKGGSTFKVLVLPIQRTTDPEVYQSGREGEFEYNIPLKPGIYELRLHFAELVYGPDELEGGGETSRLIDVHANGRQLLQSFDISADAGGSRTADVKVFTDVSPVDGFLKLNVVAYRGRGLLNAIEVLPGIPGQMRPLRMTTRQSAYFDKNRVMWEPERYFRGGRVNTRTNAISGTNEPELYQCERFGNFSYAIPVAHGDYKLTLKFAEAYWGEANAGKGGKGNRIFNVSCNGEPLLKNFDIYKEAGGENRALDRTFRGLSANAQGKLILQFTPVQNYASVSSIEVVSESKQ